jgi:hypothetical protein
MLTSSVLLSFFPVPESEDGYFQLLNSTRIHIKHRCCLFCKKQLLRYTSEDWLPKFTALPTCHSNRQTTNRYKLISSRSSKRKPHWHFACRGTTKISCYYFIKKWQNYQLIIVHFNQSIHVWLPTIQISTLHIKYHTLATCNCQHIPFYLQNLSYRNFIYFDWFSYKGSCIRYSKWLGMAMTWGGKFRFPFVATFLKKILYSRSLQKPIWHWHISHRNWVKVKPIDVPGQTRISSRQCSAL